MVDAGTSTHSADIEKGSAAREWYRSHSRAAKDMPAVRSADDDRGDVHLVDGR